MADCEEVFACIECIGLVGSSVDAGPNASFEERHASFQAVDAVWPDWEAEVDFHRNLSHHSDDQSHLEFTSESEASYSGFLESTASGLLPTNYRYYNHGRIAVSESYKSPVSKAFDEELQSFFAMGDIRTNFSSESTRMHSDQISGFESESTTEQILLMGIQGENEATFSALCGADLGPGKSESPANNFEEKIHEPTVVTVTNLPSEEKLDDITLGSLVNISTTEQQLDVSLSERVGYISKCPDAEGSKSGLMGGGSQGRKKKNCDSTALDRFREVDSDSAQSIKGGSHCPQSKKIDKDIIRIKEGPTISRSIGKGSSKSSIVPPPIHANENTRPTKETACDFFSKRDGTGSTPFKECQKFRSMGASTNKNDKSPPKIERQNLAKPVKALDDCPKQNRPENDFVYEEPLAVQAFRSRVGGCHAPVDTSSRSQQPVSAQSSDIHNKKSSHPSWKTMSTLGSETDNSDERVLIEVEQFDPIARENVWIPGTVMHNSKKGKFKAILTDKYGDQWEETFDIDQYGLCWRFAPLPEEVPVSLPNLQSEIQSESKVENHQVDVEFAEESKICTKKMKTLAGATKGRGNGHRLCNECKLVHHYRSACRTDASNRKRKISFVSPERQRKCSADSPDRRSLGITPFRKENSSRMDEYEVRVSSAARKSICFGDSGGLAGMMRERRDWSGFVGRVFGSQGEENGSFIEEESKADNDAKTLVKRK